MPDNVIHGGKPVSDSAKRTIYQEGLPGRATVLKAPGKSRVGEVHNAVASFSVRVEIEGREPYDAKTKQSFGRYEWDRLRPGAVVECRVDRSDDQKVLLIVPEPGELEVTTVSSAQILADGIRASAKVTESAPLGQTAPDTDDPIYLLNLELTSGAEPEPWKVQIGQRVPKGAEELVAAGGELKAAYIEVDGGDSVAIDWPASSDGRFA
ncbi:MAG: hypothetical protein M3O25_01435 [Actinomycetota bacterium]|nr:hypothetical protein [Actinomycetota bacterium]